MKMTIKAIDTIKENDKNVEKVIDYEIEIVENTPISKAKDNDLSFMDTFTNKANDTIKKIVDKANDKASYFDSDKNKPKSVDTIKQSVKRANEKVNLLVIIGKLLNKSTLNKNDVDVLLDYATYNNKSKIDIVIYDGLSYNEFITKYPNVTVKKIKELCDTYNLTLDFLNGKFISK